MVTSMMCSWCHESRQVNGPTYCQTPGCGHRVDVARMDCDCPPCSTRRLLIVSGAGTPFPRPTTNAAGHALVTALSLRLISGMLPWADEPLTETDRQTWGEAIREYWQSVD